MPDAIVAKGNAKFNTGDKVRFNGRAPDYIIQDLRRRSRTIVGIIHDRGNKCCYYEIGDRGKGSQGYLFRAYMLVPVNGQAHVIGRPRKRRKYNRKVNSKVLLAPQNQILGGVSAS